MKCTVAVAVTVTILQCCVNLFLCCFVAYFWMFHYIRLRQPALPIEWRRKHLLSDRMLHPYSYRVVKIIGFIMCLGKIPCSLWALILAFQACIALAVCQCRREGQ